VTAIVRTSESSSKTRNPPRQRRRMQAPLHLWPGLLLTSVIAGSAFALRLLPGVSVFSPMILATLIGVAFHNLVETPARAKAGVVFSLRGILRFAIVLLGLQLSVEQVFAIGAADVTIIVATLFVTFAFTTWFGCLLGVERKLAEMIAAGTSICGASAVIATNTVTDAPDEDVTYAVACITVFGSIAMFAYPVLTSFLHLTPLAYGLWAGASIHEIAQVVAAAFQDGHQAGQFATIAKLSRVTMLAPVVILLSLMARRRARRYGHGHSHAKVPIPWFVFAFVGMIAINSAITIPIGARSDIVTLTTFLLSVALTGMGLETDLRKLRAKGPRPLFLGLAAFLFVASFSLILVRTMA
jgi:uncharacterized integral membrane protein (TIGR00698 family)